MFVYQSKIVHISISVCKLETVISTYSINSAYFCFSSSLFIYPLRHKNRKTSKLFCQCLSRALRDDNPKLLMAASAFLLPVKPLMVSAVHTGMMEVTHLISGHLSLIYSVLLLLIQI